MLDMCVIFIQFGVTRGQPVFFRFKYLLNAIICVIMGIENKLQELLSLKET